MKSIKNLSLALFILFALANCGRDKCNNVLISDKTFEAESEDFYPYASIDKIVFADSNNIEYSFTIDVELQDPRFYMESRECGDDMEFARYSADHILKSFVSEDNSMRLSLVLKVGFLPDAELTVDNLVDLMLITVFDNTQVANLQLNSMSLVASDRGGNVNKQTQNATVAEFKNNVSLLNENFTDVYAQKTPFINQSPIYYNNEFGLLSFSDLNNNVLVFKRFE